MLAILGPALPGAMEYFMTTNRITKCVIPGVLAAAFSALPAGAVTKVQKSFEKWIVSCVEAAESNNRCTLSQNFTGINNRTKKRVPVFFMSLSENKDGVDTLIMRTPLGVDLEKRINVAFPEVDPVTVNFDVCNQRGCFSEFEAGESWLKALRANESITVTYAMRNSRDVDIEIQLGQFDEAYKFFKESMKTQ